MRLKGRLAYISGAVVAVGVLAVVAAVLLRPDGPTTTSAGPLPTATPTKPTPNATLRPTFTNTPTHTPKATPTANPNALNFNQAAGLFEITMVAGPVSKLSTAIPASQTPPFVLRLTAEAFPLFPRSGEIVVGHTELMVYDFNSNAPECQLLNNNGLCVTERAKVGQPKLHAVGAQVKLATKLQQPLPGAGAGIAHTTLSSSISAGSGPPFVMDVGDSADFPATGFITISHSQQAFSTTVGTEYFEYDNATNRCGVALVNQLCIVARALQPGNVPREHPAHDPAPTLPVYSYVDLHAHAQVKSNAGFPSAGSLVVYSVDGSNNVTEAELVDYNNAATKVKTPAANEFHLTTRGAFAGTLEATAIQAHDAFSIVTTADRYLTCRGRGTQPRPGSSDPRSVAFYLNCYSRSEPGGPPKTISPKQLNVPLTGQVLNLLNSASPPFVSGSDGMADGVLNLNAYCSSSSFPGTNVFISAAINVDKSFPTADRGPMTLVFDTTPPGSGQTGCVQPPGAGEATVTWYDAPGASDPTGDGDDDTDGDGCKDLEELHPTVTTGGLRDPWNPHDFFDPTGDDVVSIGDIAAVIAKFGLTQNDPGYDATRDRGPALGPFAHNVSGPDGSITIADISAAVTQFGHNCLA